jgi:Papain family cysteine protease
MPGFGRRYAPDARDENYPMRRLLPREASTRPYRYWFSNGWWGNQGDHGFCVAYASDHWLEDGPVTQKGQPPCIDPIQLMTEAVAIDEWPDDTNIEDGTSVRAAAKVMQAHGYISAYHWAATLDDIVQALLEVGPVVMGTNWYDTMMEPDEAGFIHIGGQIAGGHAYVLDGINQATKIVRLKNSWGRSWGANGFAFLGFADLDRLLNENGEGMLAVEVRK